MKTVLQVVGVAIALPFLFSWLNKAVAQPFLFSWLNKDDYFRDNEREFSERAEGLQPWAVFWARVMNDDSDSEEWAKVRPCIALPPRTTWVDGAPPIDAKAAGYVWYENGYIALICTSQIKRQDDPRYLEVRPFPNELTRSFVSLDLRYIVIDYHDREVQRGLQSNSNKKYLVVMEELGPLLNLEDRRRIAHRLEELGKIKKEVSERDEDTTMLKQQFETTLKAMGNPHDLWMSIMPERYLALSDDAKMDHVELIFDFVYYAIGLRNTKLPKVSENLVEERHFALAVMTGMLLKNSVNYQRVFRKHMSKDFSTSELWLRYALLVELPSSTADLHATLRKVSPEFDGDLLNRYLGDPQTKQLVEIYRPFK